MELSNGKKSLKKDYGKFITLLLASILLRFLCKYFLDFGGTGIQVVVLSVNSLATLKVFLVYNLIRIESFLLAMITLSIYGIDAVIVVD